jgi:hypothetical protein
VRRHVTLKRANGDAECGGGLLFIHGVRACQMHERQ